MIFFVNMYIAVSTPTSSIQIEPSETTNMITETAGKCVLSISSTSDPLPTSSAPAGFSGAAVGGAIAALLILAVFAAAGVTIVIVVLVRRHNLQKLTNSTCTFTPSDLDDIQGDHPPVLGQSAEQMEIQQNTSYAHSGSYKQGDPPSSPLLFNQSADPVQLQQNMSYEATSSSYKLGNPPSGPLLFNQSADPVQLQQNMSYEATSSSYKLGNPSSGPLLLFNQSADHLQQNMSYEATSDSYKLGDQVHLYVIIPL